MAAQKPETKPLMTETEGRDRIQFGPEAGLGLLKSLGGSQSDIWNQILAEQAVSGMWQSREETEGPDPALTATIAGLTGIAPQDKVEGMIAAQLITAHNAIMTCYRRANLCPNNLEVQRDALAQAAKLSRTWTALLASLTKYRGKGQQKVTVEHVHVHSGGQAVVGRVDVAGGGSGGVRKSKE